MTVLAQRDMARYRAINPRAITKQTVDNADAAERSATAKLEANRQAVAGMKAQITAADAAVDAAQASVETASADLANAKLQLSYTRIVAPTTGRVTRRTVELGNYIAPGQALLAIVQPGLWVTANFKETQLTDMKPGQPVENATGNYVKVVQRLPVKILFDGDAANDLLLAPGMSVTPTVTVR